MVSKGGRKGQLGIIGGWWNCSSTCKHAPAEDTTLLMFSFCYCQRSVHVSKIGSFLTWVRINSSTLSKLVLNAYCKLQICSNLDTGLSNLMIYSKSLEPEPCRIFVEWVPEILNYWQSGKWNGYSEYPSHNEFESWHMENQSKIRSLFL